MKAEVEKLKTKYSTEQNQMDVVQLNEVITFDPVCSASDHDENQVDEYSDGSDSSDSEIDIDNESENVLTFLRTTRSGRRITINRSIF